MIRTRLTVFLLLAGLPLTAIGQPNDEARLLERVERILRQTPLVDGHNDLPWVILERLAGDLSRIDLRDTSRLDPPVHTDLPRLRRGGVGAQFWSVYVPVELRGADAVKATIEQIDLVRRFTELHSETLALAFSADDIVGIHRSGKIAGLLGMEGGHSIDGSPAVLRQLHQLGARSMTLTHSSNTPWADSATAAPAHGGLTDFGRELVREMNRIGMLIDLSHVAPDTMRQAIEASAAPIIFTHSSARALVDHPRNVPDEILRLLPANGGIVMVTFVPSFVSEEVRLHAAAIKAEEARLAALHPGDPVRAAEELNAWKRLHPSPRATLSHVADHIDHIRKIAGIDHIGIGSDFDGITSTPAGLESVADFPSLLAELFRRGYTDDDVRKIAGANFLRAFRAVERTAKRLQPAQK
ncbi:MAG TPA: dipeptidase [Thermoanaerobaculia bacterium]|nr:dipeptidase [Thermoanaerobaculia bacterium]